MDGKLILWNYARHEQFEIDIPHLERILALSAGAAPMAGPIDATIAQSGCLGETDPDAWGWDCLSRIFHVGTQIRLEPGQALPESDGYRGYTAFCASLADKIPSLLVERPGRIFTLPQSNLSALGPMPLRQALHERRTCRDFNAEPLPLHDVSTTLWATFGAVHGNQRADLEAEGLMPIGYRRTSPSGGSLHPSEAYLVALRVEGLPPGIYHYRAHRHELALMTKPCSAGRLGALLCTQSFAADLSYGVFVTTRFDKMWWKYPHSRAYRVALIDIGCLTQTFQLACAARGIQSWPTGYFLDEEVNKLLELDNEIESAMFFLGAGRGTSAVPREVANTIRLLAAEA
jgi:SagB-type dehydrogenase family enzyme